MLRRARNCTRWNGSAPNLLTGTAAERQRADDLKAERERAGDRLQAMRDSLETIGADRDRARSELAALQSELAWSAGPFGAGT